MKKISLNFLNRLERKIFKNSVESSVAVSAPIAKITLIAAATSIAVIFVLQMFAVDQSAATIVLSITFGVALFFSGCLVYNALSFLPTTGGKIGLIAYALALFAICSVIFIQLMVWVMIAVIGLGVLWLILKAISKDSSGRKKLGRAYYSDGATEEMVETGKGILGETYYEGDKGGSHVEN